MKNLYSNPSPREFLGGWLIDPFEKTVHVYRPNCEPEILDNPPMVSGETVLPGFVLDLSEIYVRE